MILGQDPIAFDASKENQFLVKENLIELELMKMEKTGLITKCIFLLGELLCRLN